MTRIVTNYMRLAATFLVGLKLVQVLLELGTECFGLVALLGAGTGLAATLREVVKSGVVPELGRCFHRRDSALFGEAYASGFFLCAATSLITAFGFGLLALCLPLLAVPDHLVPAGQLFVLWQALRICLVIALAPSLNMLLVAERMVAFNLMTVTDRLADLIAACIVTAHLSALGSAAAIAWYGGLGCGLATVATLGWAAYANFTTVPSVRGVMRITRPSSSRMLASIGWNSVLATALNLYIRLDMVIVNIVFGLLGNLVFGLANQLTAYIRILSSGMVAGIEAVSARLGVQNEPHRLRALLSDSTRLQALVTFPASLTVFVFANELIELWVGARLGNSETEVPRIALLVRILSVGILARSLSEGWVAIMVGLGHVKRVAVISLVGALVNPVFVCLLLFLLPDHVRLTAPAFAFAVMFVVVQLYFIPKRVAAQLGVTVRDLFQPCTSPVVASTLALPWLVASKLFLDTSAFLASACAMAAVVVLTYATWKLVTTPHERRKLTRFVQRLIHYIRCYGPYALARRRALDFVSRNAFSQWSASTDLRPQLQILLLHGVEHQYIDSFRQLLAYLHEFYAFIPYSEACTRIRTGQIDKPYLSFTFDDGLESCLPAAEVMSEFDARGCFFLCSHLVENAHAVDLALFCRRKLAIPKQRFMHVNDVEGLLACGHEVGSHSLDHALLADLDAPQLERQLQTSKRRLEHWFGPIQHFAWPYGKFDHFSVKAALATADAGYLTCASGIRACYAQGPPSESHLPCIHRQSIQASWPIRHVMYFLQRHALRPITDINSWPPDYVDALRRRDASDGDPSKPLSLELRAA